MADNLEVTLRGWEINVSLEKSEQFKRNMGGFLEEKGFAKREKYWENAEMGGLRLYSTPKHTGCDTETLHLSMKSLSKVDGVPPIVNLIEQAIYNQEWILFTIERYSGYA